jgi:hypothetical protein
MVWHIFRSHLLNWESVSICMSKLPGGTSMDCRTRFNALGGAPRRHRSDSLTAAVNNHSATGISDPDTAIC